MAQARDMSLADVTTTPLTDKLSQDVLKKFQWAVKRVATEYGSDNETSLTPEELIVLIRNWEPQRDIVCLYVRWARQLKRNFNLDSIATLLCLSRQCAYTPVDFLRKVKTLSVHKNQQAAYGISFHFDTPNRKDVNRERLNKEFLGLSVTLSLLQEQVTDSPSILGKTGMRHSGPRKTYPVNIPIEENNKEQAAIITHPNMEFHTQPSLLNRIWISVNHQWLAFFLTEHLFRETDKHWSFQDALVFSFQMMAPCGPGRFDFLSPLAGYCLRFRTNESIESKRIQLRQIWNDPSLFLSYGNTCQTQFSTAAKSRIILACFEQLRVEIPSNYKQISYHRDCSWLRRWTILCAYIFHFWLDAASNSTLKSMITDRASLIPTRKKRKVHVSAELSSGRSPDHTVMSPTSFQVQDNSLMVTLPKPSSNGLQSILSSRGTSKKDGHVLGVGGDNPTAVVVGGNEQLVGKCNNKSTLSTTGLLMEEVVNATPLKDINWCGLRLIESEEMQKFVQSFLLIHRHDGMDLLAQLSPLEVYSANNLHDCLHSRLSGNSSFSVPSEKISPSTIYLRNDSCCFIDRYAKSYHVARGESEYFVEYGHILPSMHQIRLLCQAIVHHGSIDSKRAIGQYRLNMGNGGQNWVNGAPCKLHGCQFIQDITNEGIIDAAQVLQAIGGITEFTWRVMCSLQHDANDHPIAPDSFRRQLYAEHLNKYLNIHNKDIGFEDLTLVISSLYPATHQVEEHKDTMNDTLSGYTRTAAFNLVMIDNIQAQPTILHLQVICNFRKVIGRYVIPFHTLIAPVAKHARHYLDKWERSIQTVFAGKTEKIPRAYDRSTFYLDDHLVYEVVSIAEEGKHKQSISSQYILTEVNISRTLSLSMFIDSIVKLQPYLKFDQSIELAFACSFLSNPFWFDWCMTTLTRRLDDPDDPYEFGLHPMTGHTTPSTSLVDGKVDHTIDGRHAGAAKKQSLRLLGHSLVRHKRQERMVKESSPR